MNKIQVISILNSLLFSCWLTTSLSAQVIYVNAAGNGGGTSWADATPHLAEALSTATNGMQIWVATGTYYPTTCTSCTTEDRQISFQIPDGVTLIGGFSGEEDSNERDWQNNPTILSGNIDRDTTIFNNSYNVIYTKNVGISTTVDGFIITGGNADFLNNSPGARSNSGAGWYNEGVLENNQSTPTINNCRFEENQTIAFGAAMLNDGGFSGDASVFYNNCQFKNNTAGQAGGAVYNQGSFEGKNLTKFSNCLFENNHSEIEGGAIYSNGSQEGNADVQVISCTFNNNSAAQRGGAIYNRGSNNGHCNAAIIGCNFTDNQAVTAGAIYNDGGFAGESNPTITGCYFKNNHATHKGGAVLNDGNFSGQSNTIFTNCTFDKNLADTNGGGVYSDGSEDGESSPTFENCQFFNNRAQLGGGAYHFGKNGISNPVFTQCNFVGNEGEEGAGLYNDASFEGQSNFMMKNCRFSNNHSTSNGGAMYNLAAAGGEILAQLTDCDFEHNFSGFAGAGMFNSGIEGNCSPVLINCKFIGNFTDTYGAAIYNQGKRGNASPTIINTLFSKNSAFSAGAIYNLGAEFGNSNPIITNCTFYANRAHVGGAVYSNAAEEDIGTAAPVITNCIFYRNFANFGDVFRVINGEPTISYCLFDKPDCESLYSGIDGQINCGAGLIFMEEPMFVDTAGGNFHLQVAAPGIDRGDNTVIAEMEVTTDLDHQPRIQNGRVDLGVYEEIVIGDSTTTFVLIQQSGDQMLCSGMDTELSVIVEGEAPFYYQWFKNELVVPAATAANLSLVNLNENDGGAYYCQIIDGVGDTLKSDFIQISVQPEIAVSANIFIENNQLCTGQEAYFWAETAGGGDTPIYDWQVNGVSQNVNDNVFITNALGANDIVQLRLLSSEDCPSATEVFSESITLEITENAVATIEITADRTEVCSGEAVTFLATTTNSGDTPIYQWIVNDVPVGANTSTFTTTNLATTDQVSCQLTSSLRCIENPIIFSESMSIMVNEKVTPQISITTDSSQFCLGSLIEFTADITHGGDTPFLQWSVNGVIVSEGAPYFRTRDLENNDVISCLLISSENCVTTVEVSSNVFSVSVLDNCTTAIEETVLSKQTRLFPNPARANIVIELPKKSSTGEWTIYSLTGKKVVQEVFENQTILKINTTSLTVGTYWVRLNLEEGTVIKKLVIH